MSGASRIANHRARHRDADIMSTLAEFVTVIKQNQETIERLIQRHETLVEQVQLLAKQVDRLLGEGSVKIIKRAVTHIKQNQHVREIPAEPRAPARVEDDSSSKSPMELRKKPLSRSSTSPEFDAFWAIWPHKVCKTKAFESHAKALTRVTQAELLDGVRRYVATKPDSQQWCHPATWLNQDRWTDQPAPPVRQRMNGGGSNYSGLF